MFKKFIALTIIAIAMLALSGSAKSQTMYFCEGVTSDGYATGESSVFNIGRDGGYIYVLTRLPYNLNCRSVRYEIYKDGTYNTTIYQDTENNWQWFYKQITFYDSGRWTIYLIDCYDITLASGTVRIQYR